MDWKTGCAVSPTSMAAGLEQKRVLPLPHTLLPAPGPGRAMPCVQQGAALLPMLREWRWASPDMVWRSRDTGSRLRRSKLGLSTYWNHTEVARDEPRSDLLGQPRLAGRETSHSTARGERRQAPAGAVCAQSLPFPGLAVGIYSLCSKLPSLVSSEFHSFSDTPALWSSKRMLLLPPCLFPACEQPSRPMQRLRPPPLSPKRANQQENHRIPG